MSAATAPTLSGGAAALRRAPRGPDVQALAFQALELLPDAVIVLDREGRPVVTNRAADSLLQARNGLSIDAGGPRAETLPETRLLRRALAEVAPGAARSLRLGRRHGLAPLSVAIAATDDDASYVVLTVSDPKRGSAPDPEDLRQLYGLTPMESKVAARIAGGRSLPAISEELGITVQTVRGHLTQVFAKTGAHRQPELVHLLLTGPQRGAAD